jgi:Concanavalin A-like lectin/glucanases superfamily
MIGCFLVLLLLQLPGSTSAVASANFTDSPSRAQAVTATLIPSAYRDAVLANHPISYWRLDESSGTVASDQENSHKGAYLNSPTLGQPGALAGDPDTAVSFNGASQFVGVPYSAALNPTTFSVEVWAKPTGGTGTYRGVVASRSYPNGWVLYAGSNNTWQFWINNGTGMKIIYGAPVTLNAWTHLVGTFDGTTARLYVNGVLANSAAVASYQPQTSKALAIGQSSRGSGFFFPG